MDPKTVTLRKANEEDIELCLTPEKTNLLSIESVKDLYPEANGLYHVVNGRKRALVLDKGYYTLDPNVSVYNIRIKKALKTKSTPGTRKFETATEKRIQDILGDIRGSTDTTNKDGKLVRKIFLDNNFNNCV